MVLDPPSSHGKSFPNICVVKRDRGSPQDRMHGGDRGDSSDHGGWMQYCRAQRCNKRLPELM